MEYIQEGHSYSISYQNLREEYLNHCQMTDEEFIKNLPSAIHLACIICFFKEVPHYLCLNDRGIIHELAHLLHIPESNTTSVEDIRKLFESSLELS